MSIILFSKVQSHIDMVNRVSDCCHQVSTIEDFFIAIEHYPNAVLCCDMNLLPMIPVETARSLPVVMFPTDNVSTPDISNAVEKYQPAAVLSTNPDSGEILTACALAKARMTRMIQDRNRREELFSVLQQIAHTVKDQPDLIQALNKAQQVIAAAVHAVYAEIWVPDQLSDQLVHSGEAFYQSRIYEGFLQQSKLYRFRFGEGLPGQAWKSATLQWKFDVRSDSTFLQHDLAHDYQIGAGFAIPVFSDENLLAVSVYFFSVPRVTDPYIVELVNRAAWEFQQAVSAKSEVLQNKLEQEKVQDLLSFRDRFLQNLNHEIRTPMNGILGLAQVLADALDSGERREFAESIVTSAQRLMTSFEQMIFFFQEVPHNSPALDSNAPDLDVDHILTHVCEQYTLTAVRRRISYDYTMSGTSLRVLSSERLMQFLCRNLLDFTFSQAVEGGWVVLETEEGCMEDSHEDCSVVIRISFAGLPVVKTVIQALNNDSGSEQLYASTMPIGPSLPLAKRITQAFGGSFSIAALPDSVLRLTVTLPAVRHSVPAESGKLNVDSASVASRNAVLLVEDNRINQLVMKRYLASIGGVHVASQAEEAFKLALQTPYKALLLDINLGNGIGGVELLQRIRRTSGPNQHTPALAITGYTNKQDIVWLKENGFIRVLAKPLQQAKLLRLVTEAVG